MDNERIKSLEKRLEKTEKELQKVSDVEEIKRLQAIYGYYLDDSDWDNVLDLLTDDCSVEINGRGVYVGKDRAEIFFKKVLKGGPPSGYFGNHVMSQGAVTVDPDGVHAKCRYQLLIQIGVYKEAGLVLGGVYENELKKENGKWKFSRLHWYVKYCADVEKGWVQDPLPFIPPSEEFPPDIPFSVPYEIYPGHFFAPYHFTNPVTGR